METLNVQFARLARMWKTLGDVGIIRLSEAGRTQARAASFRRLDRLRATEMVVINRRANERVLDENHAEYVGVHTTHHLDPSV